MRASEFGVRRLLLQKLQATPDGGGTLLDNSCVYATSCIGDPTAHTYGGDVPILLAGRAGGALRPGTHYRSNNPNELVTAAPLTALRALGVPQGSFGEGAMTSTTPVAAVLT